MPSFITVDSSLHTLQHCRKCGGIYCSACASRFTPLLDSSALDFITPPRNVPITQFESPESPIVLSRVCEDCHDQIHGYPTTPRTPEIVHSTFTRIFSHPMALFGRFFSKSSTAAATASTPASRPPTDDDVSTSTRSTRHKQSSSSVNTGSSANSGPSPKITSAALRKGRLLLPQSMEKSYGELEAYPLRRPSVLCKATGGGRWEPKQSPVLDFYRVPVPGGKAPFEIEMERLEMLEQLRRQNPIVKDGAFKYRFTKEPEPVELSRSINRLSTF